MGGRQPSFSGRAPEHKRFPYMQFAREQFDKARYCLALSGVPMFPLDKLSMRIEDITRLDGPKLAGDHAGVLGELSRIYGVDTDHVFSTLGTSDAIFLAFGALLEPGDTVVIETPTYEHHVQITRFFHAKVKLWRRQRENNYALDMDALQDMLRAGARLVVVSNLNNPTGAAIQDAQLKRIADLCAEHGAWLFVNEVYLDFLRQGKLLPARACRLGEHVISAGSLTKVYGFHYYVRSGWLMGSPDLLRRCRALSDLTYVIKPAVAQNITYYALYHLEQAWAVAEAHLQRVHAVLQQWLAAEKRFAVTVPSHSLMCFAHLPRGLSGIQFVRYCTAKYNTNFSPGEFFGLPEGLRIALGCAPEDLAEGLSNLTKALDDWEQGRLA